MGSKVDQRARVESLFEKAQKSAREAKELLDQERDTTRKEIEQLRKLRLAKEAAPGITELDKKPAR